MVFPDPLLAIDFMDVIDTLSSSPQTSSIENEKDASLHERTTYTYSPLPSASSFRILELFPGRYEDEVVFQLHVADWENPPSYEATSYVWGTDDKVAVNCGGRLLLVTPNLMAGLRHMRLEDDSRFLWADAACINQMDFEERGYQVSNMRTIYKNSIRVLVWLGEDENGQAQEAITAMREIASFCCAAMQLSLDQVKDSDDIELPTELDDEPNYMFYDAAHKCTAFRCVEWPMQKNKEIT